MNLEYEVIFVLLQKIKYVERNWRTWVDLKIVNFFCVSLFHLTLGESTLDKGR